MLLRGLKVTSNVLEQRLIGCVLAETLYVKAGFFCNRLEFVRLSKVEARRMAFFKKEEVEVAESLVPLEACCF